MASLKDIKQHIKAVKQTQKLTKAMNMVAAAKLRTVQGRTETFRPYAVEHARLIREIGSRSAGAAHPLMLPHPEAKEEGILALSSDRGLCGSFNSNIFSRMDKKIVELRKEGLEPVLTILGRKLKDYYHKRRVTINQAMVGIMGSFDFLLAKKIAEDLTAEYLSGRYRHIWILYTKFHSLAKYEVVVEPFLPLREEKMLQETGRAAAPADLSNFDFLIEPDPDQLFGRLIPRSLAIMIFQAMLESVTSENAARMQAMDNASKNCREIIDSLTLAYNKARQASVTTELLDIVSGAEALIAA